MTEFELIRRYFQRPQTEHPLGVGDDCALLAAPAPGMQLALSTDMLIEGRHFLSDTDARLLGRKALAVNLSDLAACGARPVAFTLSLALPQAQPAWCQAFAQGLFEMADAHGCTLVGGDTTRGPVLTIGITVFGHVPAGLALLRSGARAGDEIWVSGTLGDARMALQALQRQHALPAPVLEHIRGRLENPQPRLALGQALRGMATAAIDVSDGLLADLGHILAASGGLGASIDLPSTRALLQAAAHPHPLMMAMARERIDQCTLAGGDDYELCFTAPAELAAAIEQVGRDTCTPVTRIGRVDAEPGLRLLDEGGRLVPAGQRFAGFDHFS